MTNSHDIEKAIKEAKKRVEEKRSQFQSNSNVAVNTRELQRNKLNK